MANADHALALLAPRPLGREVWSSSFILRLWRGLRRTLAVGAFLLLWEAAPRLGLTERAFLPPLSEVLRTGLELLENGQLVSHVQASLSRSLLGFLIAISCAVPLGLAIGWYRPFASVVSPLLEAMRNTAALALLPVFILLLGIGEASKVAIVVYSCSFPILLNTISGVRNVDPLLIKSARTMGLSPIQLFKKVILPAAVPTIFVGIRLAGAYSLLVLVAAEMIGAKAGLGYLIIYAQYNFQIPDMYVGILSLTVVGLCFNQALLQLEKHFTRWKPTLEAE
jgi:NitT/TauT family transport system permease protein